MKKRQPRKRQYREVRARLAIENWSYVNSLDTDGSYSKNLNRVIEEHRRSAHRTRHNVPSGTSIH